MASHLTGSTRSEVKGKRSYSLLFQRRKSVLSHIFLPTEDHITILCEEHAVAKYSGMQIYPTNAPGRGVFKQIHLSGQPYPPALLA